MATKANNFDSVVAGALVSSGTATSGTQVTLSKSGTATCVGTLADGEKIYGNASVLFNTITGESGYGYWSWTSVAQAGIRAAFRFLAGLTAVTDIVTLLQTPGGAKACSVRLQSDGRLVLKDYNGTNTLYTTDVLTFPGVYQIDLSCQPGTGATDGKITFAVYNQAGALTAGMSAPYAATNVNAGTLPINTVNVGKTSSTATAMDFVIDVMESRDTYGLIGAYVAPTVPVCSYQLTQNYPSNSSSPSNLVVDTTASVGTVTLSQTDGTTATVTQSPTGVFTITNPTGTDDLIFSLTATSGALTNSKTFVWTRGGNSTNVFTSVFVKQADNLWLPTVAPA